MTDYDYNNADALAIIEDEGTGYAVQHYCDAKHFDDPKTRKLWTAAEKALNELEAYLKPRAH